MWWWTSPTSKALPRMRSDTPGATTTMTRAAFLLGKFLLHRGSLHVSVCRHPKPPFFCLLSELLCLFLCSTLLPMDPFQCENYLRWTSGVGMVVKLKQCGNTGDTSTYGGGCAMLSLGRHKIGYFGSTGPQGVYFIVSAPGTEHLEVRTVGAEGIFGEGAV